MTGIIVTGTDTGVGKTFCAGLIAAAARRRGLETGVFKPVETGWRSESGEEHDAELLRQAAASDLPLDLICPYRFRDPLAPLTAASREGLEISLARIKQAYGNLANRCDLVVVEGAGGLLVPLTAQASFADLPLMLDIPLLIVVGSRLGAVNHALLTIEVARQKRISIVGYVLNHPWPDSSVATETNRETLLRTTSVPCLGQVPYFPAASFPPMEPQALALVAEKHLSLEWLDTGSGSRPGS